MFTLRSKYHPRLIHINTRRVSKSETQPNQSMSLKEMVKRFVRGIPVDMVRREGVFMDHENTDFEKLSRMDFAEKIEYAEQYGKRAQEMEQALKERQDRHDEAERRKKDEAIKPPAPKKSARKAGIENLDNTMPDDTTTGNQ